MFFVDCYGNNTSSNNNSYYTNNNNYNLNNYILEQIPNVLPTNFNNKEFNKLC